MLCSLRGERDSLLFFEDLFDYLEKHANQSIEDIFIAWDIADTVLIEASTYAGLSLRSIDDLFLRPSTTSHLHG